MSHSEKTIMGKYCPKIVILLLIFWGSIPCVCCSYNYTLLKVVSHCDLSVLSMSVMDFQKKFGWVGLFLFF